MTLNTSLIFPEYTSYHRANKLRDILAAGSWDIVGLCEVYNSSLRKVMLGDGVSENYPWILSATKKVANQDNGLVLLTKYRILHHEHHQYQYNFGWFSMVLPPKDILFAVIDIDGIEVAVFLTHLMWGNTPEQVRIRKENMNELRRYIEEKHMARPFILLGDINIDSYDRHGDLTHFNQVFGEFNDWWVQTQEGPGYTWDPINSKVITPLEFSRLDYIVSSDQITPEQTKIHRFDHYSPRIKYFPKSIRGLERIYYVFMMTIGPILLLPAYLSFWVIFNIIRILHGSPISLYYVPHDLSDHFALEGRAKLRI